MRTQPEGRGSSRQRHRSVRLRLFRLQVFHPSVPLPARPHSGARPSRCSLKLPVLTGASCNRGHYRRMSDDIGWRLKMTAEVGQFDPETELIEVSVDLFIASMALEEGKERAYLHHLRKAQAHLTGLIPDAEKQGPPASRSPPMGRPSGWANASSSSGPSLCRLPLGPPSCSVELSCPAGR